MCVGSSQGSATRRVVPHFDSRRRIAGGGRFLVRRPASTRRGVARRQGPPGENLASRSFGTALGRRLDRVPRVAVRAVAGDHDRRCLGRLGRVSGKERRGGGDSREAGIRAAEFIASGPGSGSAFRVEDFSGELRTPAEPRSTSDKNHGTDPHRGDQGLGRQLGCATGNHWQRFRDGQRVSSAIRRSPRGPQARRANPEPLRGLITYLRNPSRSRAGQANLTTVSLTDARGTIDSPRATGPDGSGR